jgi:hypothetical protein
MILLLRFLSNAKDEAQEGIVSPRDKCRKEDVMQ